MPIRPRFGYGLPAAQQLAAGFPIYYRDPAYEAVLVKEWPDGRRELLRCTVTDETVVGQAAPADPAEWRQVVDWWDRRPGRK